MKTNRIIMALFGLLLVVLVFKQLPTTEKPLGAYYLSSMRPQGVWKKVPDSLYSYADSLPVMRFLENDTVELLPVFGNLFFGETRFHYQVTRTEIRLSNGTNKRTIPYQQKNELLLLGINQEYFRTLTLSKHHKMGTSPTLVGSPLND